MRAVLRVLIAWIIGSNSPTQAFCGYRLVRERLDVALVLQRGQ